MSRSLVRTTLSPKWLRYTFAAELLQEPVARFSHGCCVNLDFVPREPVTQAVKDAASSVIDTASTVGAAVVGSPRLFVDRVRGVRSFFFFRVHCMSRRTFEAFQA